MALDLQYLMVLQHLRETTGGILNTFFLYITTFGVPPLTYFVMFCIYWSFDKDLGQTILMGFGTGRFMNGLLKLTCCIYRPWIRSDAVVPPGDAKAAATGYSFPSGHSTSATAVFGTAAYHYRRQRVLSVLLLLVLLLIMFSRNYLGVHTPEDVLVGFAVTAVLTAGMYHLRIWIEKGTYRDWIFFAVCCVFVALSIVYFSVKTYPLDYDAEGKLIVDPVKMMPDSYSGCGVLLGIVLGWMLERRFVRFSTDCSGICKAERCTGGMLLAAVLNTVLPKLLAAAGKNWSSFAAGFILMFVCVAVYPALFSGVRRMSSKSCADSSVI